MTTDDPSGHRGHLFIVGGGEDRKNDKLVLSRFVELCGGPDARIFVLTAASTLHDEMWALYDEAFEALGVRQRSTALIASREDAGDERIARELYEADGIFMTGGDQKRLLALIGGTRIDEAMHRALRERGACIGGTSAGASAMSAHMLTEGKANPLPTKGTVHLGAGLGLVSRVIIDQHFSERQRLGRLLSVIAQNPYLLGAGIDEDTALIVRPGRGIEVIGQGAVTVVDGREMLTNYIDAARHESLELVNVRLHLLPAGARYDVDAGAGEPASRPVPRGLRQAIGAIASIRDAAERAGGHDAGD
ncbi:cyanophycinase [Piscinibacter koreensis]|uniref:Cyanophycinase n=1 Tax=Piscinibacter koreensis TaxID=2742824 RepID=A0A7Y6NME2_9BURK|nr:cyanophycinase [Schlegelella koreensis]NUZ05873.1 cyanophycinase [Schlegelella koreensis]